jgi:hypothetical protein
LVAPVFDDSSIWADRRNVKTLFHVFVVDDLIVIPCNDDDAFRTSVSFDRCKKGSDTISFELCKLFCVAPFEVSSDNLIDLFYRRRLPLVHGESLLSLDS